MLLKPQKRENKIKPFFTGDMLSFAPASEESNTFSSQRQIVTLRKGGGGI